VFGIYVNTFLLSEVGSQINKILLKSSLRQERLDTVNEILEYIELDAQEQNEVRGFFQITEIAKEQSDEINLFLGTINEKLRKRVIYFIFSVRMSENF
jgi:hypothetical protein